MNWIYSMTGFAAVRRTTAAGELQASLRTVNGRNLDLHFHLNSDFAPFENVMRQMVRAHVRRGHVEIRFSLTPANAGAGCYNRDLLARYLTAFRAAQAEFSLAAEPDLNQFLSMPGVLDSNAPVSSPVNEADVVAALEECLAALNEFRTREGSELAAAVVRELDEIERHLAGITEQRESVTPALKARLQERLAALLAGAEAPLARIAEEAALLTDRSDVQEELIRLQVHAREARRMLSAPGDVGKQLDFLMQEMNREANTVLSKTSGIGEVGLAITNFGIALKANIERIREQALNLE